MGYATIVSGGTDARYTIRLDFGESVKTAVLAALSAAVAQLGTRQAEAAARASVADDREAEQRARVDAAIESFIELTRSLQPGSPEPSTAAVTFEMQQLAKMRQAHAPLRLLIERLKFEVAGTLRRIAYWNQFDAIDVRDAWCTTFTEDVAADTLVATIDIPGDTNLLLIAPECRSPTNADGFMRGRAVLSPEQAYFNAAIFPGWQKFLPTYRWGTITAIDEEAGTASVTLAATTSTAQTLNVNQADDLVDVPVEYLDCGVGIFDVGDRVVVQFVNQDWATPKVIGFLDNPRPCNWPCIHLIGSNYLFESLIESTMNAIFGLGVTFECRLNGGAWQAMSDSSPPTASILNKVYRFDDGLSPSEDQPAGAISVVVVKDAQTDPVAVDYQAPPRIVVIVSPSGPFPPARPLEDRNIAEIRISTDATIFNVAARDMGWGTEGVTDGYAKTRGGIALRGFPNSAGTNVLPLDYTLEL